MATVDNFLSYIRANDVARGNLFAVSITPPMAMIGSVSSIQVQDVMLMANGFTTPTISTHGTPASYGNRPSAEIPHSIVMGADSIFNASFIIDGGYMIRKFFDRWMWLFGDPVQFEVAFFEKAVSPEVTIQYLDRANIPRYGYRLFDVFPKVLPAISSRSGPSDVIVTQDVTFGCSRWEPMEIVEGYAAPPFSRNPNDFLKTAISTITPFINFPIGAPINSLPFGLAL